MIDPAVIRAELDMPIEPFEHRQEAIVVRTAHRYDVGFVCMAHYCRNRVIRTTVVNGA